MPHCIIEYADELEHHAEELINAAHAGLLSSNLFTEDHIKIRAISFKHYKKGKHAIGAQSSCFVHIAVHILAGRTTEQKSHLSRSVLASTTETLPNHVNISIEILDIDSQTYIKN